MKIHYKTGILERVVSPSVDVRFDGININFSGSDVDGVLIEHMSPFVAARFARALLAACKKHGEQSIKEAEKVLRKIE